ncbi:hypothetical protein AB0383_45020 [Amycolatopsis sp. NPDC051373]|uniref:hypothetical protein n=1 Tax=Amycolatopsis sp. NPDC051373 TaxID=3155801 RepID=UPI003450B382
MSNQEWWVSIAAAAVSALAAVVAAIIASRTSKAIRRSELNAQRVRDLEERLHGKKYDVYKPMINMLRDLLGTAVPEGDAQAELIVLMKDFSTWITIFGSDEAIVSFHNFMQGAFKDGPIVVMMRLYADFILAARKDMGYPDTAVQREHLLGVRINDIYEYPQFMESSFDRLCQQAGWTPPWQEFASVRSSRQVNAG